MNVQADSSAIQPSLSTTFPEGLHVRERNVPSGDGVRGLRRRSAQLFFDVYDGARLLARWNSRKRADSHAAGNALIEHRPGNTFRVWRGADCLTFGGLAEATRAQRATAEQWLALKLDRQGGLTFCTDAGSLKVVEFEGTVWMRSTAGAAAHWHRLGAGRARELACALMKQADDAEKCPLCAQPLEGEKLFHLACAQRENANAEPAADAKEVA